MSFVDGRRKCDGCGADGGLQNDRRPDGWVLVTGVGEKALHGCPSCAAPLVARIEERKRTEELRRKPPAFKIGDRVHCKGASNSGHDIDADGFVGSVDYSYSWPIQFRADGDYCSWWVRPCDCTLLPPAVPPLTIALKCCGTCAKWAQPTCPHGRGACESLHTWFFVCAAHEEIKP